MSYYTNFKCIKIQQLTKDNINKRAQEKFIKRALNNQYLKDFITECIEHNCRYGLTGEIVNRLK